MEVALIHTLILARHRSDVHMSDSCALPSSYVMELMNALLNNSAHVVGDSV